MKEITLDQLHKLFTQYFINKLGWSKEDKAIKSLYEAQDEDDIYIALYYIAEVIGARKGWGEEGIGGLQAEFIKELDIDNIEII